MTSLFSHKPTLTGSLVQLRPFNDSAIDAMIEILREPDALRKTASAHSRLIGGTDADEQATRDWYALRNTKDNRLDLAVFAPALNRYVGEVVFNEYNATSRSVNYRICISSAGQNRGYGTQATKLMVDYGFEHLDLNRIELEVVDFNQRARHVYTSCGFIPEGRRRQAFFIDGTYHDAVIKSVLRSDWEANRSMSGHLNVNYASVEV